MEEAFEQCAMAMFGYMTDTETVEPLDTVEVEAEGKNCTNVSRWNCRNTVGGVYQNLLSL